MTQAGWNKAALVLGCIGVLAGAAGPASARQTPASPSSEAPAKPAHLTRRHHHHVRPRHKLASGSVQPLPEGEAALGARHTPKPDANGYVPAPVVSQPPAATEEQANILPPQQPVPQEQKVSPQTMQLHYPFAGNGYVTGSSPQAMDDATTAKVPGVIVQMPIKPDTPQPLPPP